MCFRLNMLIIIIMQYPSAPHASLDGLPDNILLFIMASLDIRSLLRISLVCHRFHQLHTDVAIWNSVNITRESVGGKLDARKVWHIIRTYVPKTLTSIKLMSNAFSAKQPVVTEPLLNFLLEKCSDIRSFTLHKCDLTVVSECILSILH